MLLYCLREYMDKIAEGVLVHPPLLMWARMVGDTLFEYKDRRASSRRSVRPGLACGIRCPDVSHRSLRLASHAVCGDPVSLVSV